MFLNLGRLGISACYVSFSHTINRTKECSTRKLCIGHNDMPLDFIADAPSRCQYNVI